MDQQGHQNLSQEEEGGQEGVYRLNIYTHTHTPPLLRASVGATQNPPAPPPATEDDPTIKTLSKQKLYHKMDNTLTMAPPPISRVITSSQVRMELSNL